MSIMGQVFILQDSPVFAEYLANLINILHWLRIAFMTNSMDPAENWEESVTRMDLKAWK